MTPLGLTAATWSFIVLPVLIVWALGVADIVRRPLPREQKAGWILVVVLLPIVGTLVYFVLRKPTPEEVRHSRAASADFRGEPLREVEPRPPLD
jgi:Phospholipase_D-nuclease N-terminal